MQARLKNHLYKLCGLPARISRKEFKSALILIYNYYCPRRCVRLGVLNLSIGIGLLKIVERVRVKGVGKVDCALRRAVCCLCFCVSLISCGVVYYLDCVFMSRGVKVLESSGESCGEVEEEVKSLSEVFERPVIVVSGRIVSMGRDVYGLYIPAKYRNQLAKLRGKQVIAIIILPHKS